MIIKIEDIGFNNKGAALMLYAIVQQLKDNFSNQPIKIVVKDYLNDFKQFADLDLYREAHFHKYGINFLKFIPNVQLVNARLVNPDHIDIIINASGFSIGDFWANFIKKSGHNRLHQYKKVKKRGGKVIFMPQAFGPFTETSVVSYVKELKRYVDVFYARDSKSYEYLVGLIGGDKVKKYPDFTNLYTPAYHYSLDKRYVALIPNAKMIVSQTSEREEYLQLFVTFAKQVQETGLQVVLLNHEGQGDYDLMQEIVKVGNLKDVILLTQLNADQVKGVLKNAYVVVSSRFHGAVSSLSQNVPLLVTSWSHKYEELLRDYQQEDCVVYSGRIAEAQDKMAQLITHNDTVRHALAPQVKAQKEMSQKLWNDVFEILSVSS